LYDSTSCYQEFENAPYVIKGDEIIPITPVEILKYSVDKAKEIMQKELSNNSNINQNLIEYYQNIKKQFGSPRRCKYVLA